MKKYDLIASLTLMRELYNKKSNNIIRDILAEFISNIVVFQDKNVFTLDEIKYLLSEIYGFEIPKLIISNTIRKSLKDRYSQADGIYTFLKKEKNNFQMKMNKSSDDCDELINLLYRFIEENDKKIKVHENKEEIKEEFFNFLLGKATVADKYSKLIAGFIVVNEGDKKFEDVLKLIKEGVIIYKGITYIDNLTNLTNWNDNLTIFLGTEHLFNVMNYNDKVYKDIFDDFHILVKDINLKNSTKKGSKKKSIKLKYLSETKEEIKKYFKTAEKIFSENLTPYLSRPAMSKILEGINEISDIKIKEFNFFKDLNMIGIKEDETEYLEEKKIIYNLASRELFENINDFKNYMDKERKDNEIEIGFKILSKINYLRRGDSKKTFNKIGYIYMTDNNLVLNMGHNIDIKEEEFDVPFAKEIEFMTAKFWFLQNKGFNNGGNIPKSFDKYFKSKRNIKSNTSNRRFKINRKI